MVTPPTIQVANLGMADSLILMVLALVVFGPRRLPEIGRKIGKLMYEFRKASNDFKFQMEEELRNAEDADRRKKEEERQRALALSAPAQTIEGAEVAQALEAGTEATASETPGEIATGGVESPYPGEYQYPEMIEPPAETPVAESSPTITIQPPTVGEQIPATPPNSVAAVATAETPEAGAATEQTHNG
jgi:sec-independent protein translocase protein TatB